MANLLWLNWSGGGNLPPSLGIARALQERGHTVAFAGRPEMVERVQTAGFRAIELQRSYEQVERYPAGTPLTKLACYLTSPAVGEEIRAIVAAESPDALCIDAMFPAALDAAADCDVPSAVFCHTFLMRLREQWNGMGARLNAMREQAGFSALPPLETLWKTQDRTIVTTLAELDTPSDPQWTSLRHVGPVLEDEKYAVPVELPWDDNDPAPLVLVTFSTGFEQRSVDKFQRTLDALAEQPVHVVATTAGLVGAEELSAPENAFVVPYAAHDPILERAALVVTHGGHGTLMRSLKYGVPMIVMPGLAHDQAPNASAVAQWGAGIALAGDATAAQIRSAAETILATPAYKDAASGLAMRFAGLDSAGHAAREVESLPLVSHT